MDPVYFCEMNHGVWEHLTGAILAAGFIGLFTFGICFVALSICTACYKKRVKKLEDEPDDDMTV